MNRDRQTPASAKMPRRFLANHPVLLGALASLAMLAGWSAVRASRQRHRRYADHAMERRAPLSLFVAGDYPRRRQIDRSGAHPLFERRQAVYEAY